MTIKQKEFSQIFKEIAAKQIVKRTKKRIELKNRDKRFISKIKLNGNKNYTRGFVLGKLNIKEGDSISRSEITQKINLLSATNNYEKITYTFKKT